jgi:transposase
MAYYLLWGCLMERKEYSRYTREFKLEAVRLASIGDRPKAQIARELGIRVNQLRNWRLEFEQEERTGVPKRTPVIDDDLGRLRRENAKLKEENELLKKAAIYFAREST